MQSFWAYSLASQPRGTLYVGVTNSLVQRVADHRAGRGSTFTRKFKVHRLVWYEEFDSVTDAIPREKSLKRYLRDWKITLIERDTPHWIDLYAALPGVRPLPKDWAPVDDRSSGQARG